MPKTHFTVATSLVNFPISALSSRLMLFESLLFQVTTVEEEFLGIEQNEQKRDLYYNIDSMMMPSIQKDGKKIQKVKPTILH